MSKQQVGLSVIAGLLVVDIALRLGFSAPVANAQTGAERPHPVALAAATTDNGNYLLYRMWSNESIDVRLVNPMRTPASDWPEHRTSPKGTNAGISFQDGWKLFQAAK